MSVCKSGFVVLALFGSVGTCSCFGASLTPIREITIADTIGVAKSAGGGARVDALSFSPDNKKIAIVAAPARRASLFARLLIANVERGGYDDIAEVSAGGQPPQWSGQGDSVLAEDRLVRLVDGATCAIPGIFWFASAERIVSAQMGPVIGTEGIARTPKHSTEFTIFDLSCQPIANWQTDESWALADVSADRGIGIVEKLNEEVALVQVADGRVIRRWSAGQWPNFDAPKGSFADGGKVLCGVVGVGSGDEGHTVRCWRADSGQLIASAPQDKHPSTPIATATESTRVVFSEYRLIRGPIRDMDGELYTGAAVWDFAKNEIVASWHPRWQSFETNERSPRTVRVPNKVAISKDGKYVAEGGGGKIVVYRVDE